MDAINWSYYKVYLGRYTQQMDYAAVRLAEELKSHFAPEQWHFLRYIDGSGPHLRVRWRGGEPAATKSFEGVVEDLLCEMVYTPSSTYRPMVNLGHAPEPDAFEGRQVVQAFAYRDDYHPEYEPFHGLEFMEVAHDLFQRSSELAVAILAADLKGSISRKSLAPALMRRVLSAFVPPAEQADFLESYLQHWTVHDGISLDYLVPDFEAKALALLDREYDLEPEEPEARAVLAEWEAVLAAARVRYGDLLPDRRLFPDNLPFRFMHLMNNRLGIGILDEAYLAAVLRAYVERRR